MDRPFYRVQPETQARIVGTVPPPRPLPPVEAVELLRQVDSELVSLLRGLPAEDWDRLAVKQWSVRDVAAHLLDTALRRLSLDRDRHRPPAPGHGLARWEELVAFLNELNATWVEAARRLSPAVLTELLAWACPQVGDYFASLDPQAEATFPVAWAGEESSLVWMDVAREFTERWHHQQQIRQAVGAPGIDRAPYLEPLLATLMRGVLRAYREVAAPLGTRVRIATTAPDAAWLLARETAGWFLYRDEAGLSVAASVTLPAEATWKLFLRATSGEKAMDRATLSGDRRLAEPFFRTVSLMA
jgi:Mycothiol maleylpyruvate isomerase N-terminal domain